MKPSLILAATVGPVTANVLGYDVPLLSAALALLGVVLASVIAPSPRLSFWQKIALTILLVLLMLALVINDPARSPVLTTVWAIGIGYTGLPIIESIARVIRGRVSDLTGDGANTSSSTDPVSEDRPHE